MGWNSRMYAMARNRSVPLDALTTGNRFPFESSRNMNTLLFESPVKLITWRRGSTSWTTSRSLR